MVACWALHAGLQLHRWPDWKKQSAASPLQLHRALQCSLHSCPNLKYWLVVAGLWIISDQFGRLDCLHSQLDLSTQVTHLYNDISSHALAGFITVMGAFPGQPQHRAFHTHPLTFLTHREDVLLRHFTNIDGRSKLLLEIVKNQTL